MKEYKKILKEQAKELIGINLETFEDKDKKKFILMIIKIEKFNKK